MKNYNNIGLLAACLILTNDNYGSMLQSFATQTMLSNYNIKYELIIYKKDKSFKQIIKTIPRIFNGTMQNEKINEFKKTLFLKKHPEVLESKTKRKVVFDKFRKEYFKAPVVIIKGYKNLVENGKKYNCYLVGSDQLWSPSGLPTNFYNLMFAQDSKIKISYASSFGVKKIPWYQISRTRKFLNRIEYVSCRENTGKEIVKNLTGKDVPVVVDPTFLFDGNEWQKMLKTERVINEPYIFTYILGTSYNHRESVLKLKEKTGLKIVSIHQFTEADLNFGDIVIENAGPAEFVDLIKNAEYICTDSFHGSVFSILNHKKFVVFNRYSNSSAASKNTRIDSLCENLKLKERRFSSGDIYEKISKEIDYDDVEKIIKEMREKSYEYLESAFSSVK